MVRDVNFVLPRAAVAEYGVIARHAHQNISINIGMSVCSKTRKGRSQRMNCSKGSESRDMVTDTPKEHNVGQAFEIPGSPSE